MLKHFAWLATAHKQYAGIFLEKEFNANKSIAELIQKRWGWQQWGAQWQKKLEAENKACKILEWKMLKVRLEAKDDSISKLRDY